MISHNDITGDKIRTKGVFSKEAEDRFDEIFRKKPEWKKHDGSDTIPEQADAWIEVETWTSESFKELARNLEWKYVKFYRVVDNKDEK